MYCINSIGYVLLAVIKTIISKRNDLELIMNIQTIILINKYINKEINKNIIKKGKKTRYDDGVQTRNLHGSLQAIHQLCYLDLLVIGMCI